MFAAFRMTEATRYCGYCDQPIVGKVMEHRHMPCCGTCFDRLTRGAEPILTAIGASPQANAPQQVIVTGLNVPIADLVLLCMKLLVATVPAGLLAIAVYSAVRAIVAGAFLG